MAEEELKIIINALEPALRESLIQLSKSKLNDNPSKGQDYELAFDVNERNI